MSRKRAARIAVISRLFSRLGDGYFCQLLGLTLVCLEEQSASGFLRTGLIGFFKQLPFYLPGKNRFSGSAPVKPFLLL